MHPPLRIALLLCPREFRQQYENEIAINFRHPTLGAAFELASTGLAMHLENAVRDLSLAVRSLSRAPAYAIVVIVAIALAVGANVAVGSVLEGVLFHPLPYPNAQRLVFISEMPGSFAISYPDSVDIRNQTRTFVDVGLSHETSSTLTGKGAPISLPGRIADGGYFGVLGVAAELGRFLNASDGGTSNIVISDAIWRTYFAASSSVLGSRVVLDGKERTIVGVAPATFRDPSFTPTSFWAALDPRDTETNGRADEIYTAIARLRNGASAASARADLSRITKELIRKYPQSHSPFAGVSLVPFLTRLLGPVESLLWLLYAAVAIVLLVACANIANLHLVRISIRDRELVVRSALGASRARIVTQLATETGLLALCGGVLGIAMAFGALRLFDSFGSQVLPRWENVSIDGRVLVYAAVLVLFCTLLASVLPGVLRQRGGGSDLRTSGREDDRTASKRVRAGLVVAEIALAIALVSSAGLVLRSFVALTHVPVGFDAANVYDVQFDGLPGSYGRGGSYQASLRYARDVVRGLRAIPGVTIATVAWSVPFNGFPGFDAGMQVPGKPDPHKPSAVTAIAPGFFRALRIPLLYGRDFSEADRTNSQPVAIVNAAFARSYFETENVVGRQIRPTMCMVCPHGALPNLTIVGVVGNVRGGFDKSFDAALFFPMTQLTNFRNFLIRTNGHDVGLANAVDAVFERVDSRVPAPKVVPYATLLAQNALQARSDAILFGVLAFITLFLALAGLYSVTAYSVAQRTHEFGIRKAMGARAEHVLGGVLSAVMLQSATGIAIGLAVTAAFSRALDSVLFQTSALDPLTLGAVVVLVVGCALLAALVPAFRATRVDPVVSLRYE